MSIALYVNHFRHHDVRRQAEIDECLRSNIDNPTIDRVVVLGQSGMQERFASPKVSWIEGDYSGNRYDRPTFRNFFELANRFVESPDSISIVSNSDIYFDDSLALLETADLQSHCLALTRWEVTDSAVSVEAYDNSQDAWIFQGRIRPIGWTDFSMGVFGCDNRLAYELRRADYLVENPCYDLRSFHLHRSDVRFNGECISGPWDTVIRRRWNECEFAPKCPASAGIIAYSLWGAEAKYVAGALENGKLAKHVYPGWIVRFYVDDSVSSDVVSRLRDLHCEVVAMPRGEGRSGAFWRFLVADDRSAARWMVRDVDSRLNYRERRAVDDWIASGRSFHAMRDHPYHTRPILAGAFGGLRGSVGDMAGKIASWGRKTEYGDDEEFLACALWDSVSRDALVHDAFASAYDDRTRPFPTPREFGRFVGERCHHDELWVHGDRDALWKHERARRM